MCVDSFHGFPVCVADFTTLAETASVGPDSTSPRDSRVYQNVQADDSEHTHQNPAFNYDHVDMRSAQDSHTYEPHCSPAKAGDEADPLYQNAGASASPHGGGKWKKKKQKKTPDHEESHYGNVVDAKPEATYGNV